MAATEHRIALIGNAFRYAIASDNTVASVVPTAATEERPGYFDSSAEARAVNDTVFALKSDMRAGFYELEFEADIPVVFNGQTPRIAGSSVEGLISGRDYLVVAAEGDGHTTKLTVWG